MVSRIYQIQNFWKWILNGGSIKTPTPTPLDLSLSLVVIHSIIVMSQKNLSIWDTIGMKC